MASSIDYHAIEAGLDSSESACATRRRRPIALIGGLGTLSAVCILSSTGFDANANDAVTNLADGYWTTWSNDNFRGWMNAPMVCDNGGRVTTVVLREQPGYGLINGRIVCEEGGTHTSNNNFRGADNQAIHSSNGFGAVTTRDQAWYGLITARFFYGQTYDQSNANMNGFWNPQLSCSNGAVVGGIQFREQPFYGIINARVYCTQVHVDVTRVDLCVVPQAVYSGDSSGYREERLQVTTGSRWSSSYSSNTKTSLDLQISAKAEGPIGVMATSFSGSMRATVNTALSSANAQQGHQETTSTQIIRVDFSKPCYIYQGQITAYTSDGGSVTYKGIFVQSSTPLTGSLCHFGALEMVTVNLEANETQFRNRTSSRSLSK